MKDLEIIDLSGIAASMGHKPDTAEAAKLAASSTVEAFRLFMAYAETF